MGDYASFDYGGADFRDSLVGSVDESPGYDDQFNDGVMRASLSTSTRARPDMWPKSASEMSRHTSVSDSLQPDDHDAALLRAALSTSGRTRPDMWPKSASEMASHVDFPEQSLGSDVDTAHMRWAMRGSAPAAGRDGWVFMPHSKKWVKAR
jgi:hypothetical protein